MNAISEQNAEVIGTSEPAVQASIRKTVWAGALGTLIEYFDYTIYAFLATTLAQLFFPSSGNLALLYTFAVFGVAFVVRPLGGIVLGAVADKYGRKPALMLSVIGMISATVMIGVLPTYSHIGVLAPVLLCLLRCVQGLAAGGEMGGAAAYVAEVSPDDRRGGLTSTTQIGCLFGTMGGAIAVAVLHSMTTPEQLLSWGWRIPFLISIPLGIVTLAVRNRMEETHEFVSLERQGKVEKAPTLSVIRNYPRGVFSIACIGMGSMSAYYLTFTYLVTYFQRESIMSAQMAGWSSTLSMLIASASIYFWGSLSDRIGRRPVLIGATLCYITLTYPLFHLMSLSPVTAVVSQVVLGLVEAAYLSVVMATYCELFPPSVRTSGINLGFNIAAIVAGGSSPYIATWLITNTGSATSPAWIMIAGSTVSLFVALSLKETAGKPMRTE
ncbi:MFS transporter [Paraburkholderia sediminicola]|uniref:MFS transporter n=1 Tax=Paraburkholderia sediminicola TaxID=458836 RepID=UPI0038BC4A68